MISPFTVSVAIFIITFGLIFAERVHRTVIGFLGAIAMVLAGISMDFYHPDQAVESIDFSTIGLLFGMMLIVVVLEKTGFFQYLGILTAKKTKGDPWLLVVALGTLTTVLSFILDNVTTVILIVPITIIIADKVKINPTPMLMAEALLSDVGGVATLVGDPPNIMIGSAAGFSFNDFLVYSLPVVIGAWMATLFILKIVFREQFKQKPQHVEELMAINEKEAITDPKTIKKVLGVLGFVILLFLVHHALHIPPALVALMGAAVTLFLVSAHEDPQEILEEIELSVLLFFASLFVIVGGLEHAGVLKYLSTVMMGGIEDNLLMTALIVLWASAILSAIVDNIPLTVAMIPIIAQFESTVPGINILWWSLAFGVGFGGNGSPIGSTANVVVVAKSEQTETPITFRSWLKSGVSTMVGALLVATVALVVFQDWFMTPTQGYRKPAAEQTEHQSPKG